MYICIGTKCLSYSGLEKENDVTNKEKNEAVAASGFSAPGSSLRPCRGLQVEGFCYSVNPIDEVLQG